MAIERANPLPPGRYWVDVFSQDSGTFRAWLANNLITVENQKEFLPVGDYPGRTWYLFSVDAPVPWFGPGFPTIADNQTHVPEDTADRPPPPPPISEQLEDAVSAAAGIPTMIAAGAAVAILALGLYTLSKR